MLKGLDGQSIFKYIAKTPSPLIRSKAFVKSMKAIYISLLCSLHFFRICRTYKVMIMVD